MITDAIFNSSHIGRHCRLWPHWWASLALVMKDV